MLTTIRGLSLEPPPAEAEFLRRELGIAWEHVDETQMESAARSQWRTLLVMSEPEPYREILHRLERDSVIALMVSDEAYSPDRLALAVKPSVVRTYRNYAAAPASLASVTRAVTGFISDAGRADEPRRTALPNARAGWMVRERMSTWAHHGDRIRSVPLGYTDVFADAFGTRRGVGRDDSLFAGVGEGSDTRPHSIVFRGNRGLAPRIVACTLTERVKDSRVELIDADWSGRAGRDAAEGYIDQLESARFALCPPGFVNNESFRFYEALLCGALPIEVAVATTHLGEIPWRDAGSIRGASWGLGLRRADEMSEIERGTRVRAARTLVATALSTIAENIRADLEYS